MNLSEIMLKRRSVRKFKSGEIPESKLDSIIRAALLAPTSRNRNPCEFIVVKDKNVLRELSAAKKAGALLLSNADAAIAVFADSEKADTWIEDSSIALTYMMLAATEQGIGNCWVQYHLRFDENGESAEDNARRILSMPDKYRIVGVLGLGIPDEFPEAKTMDELDFEKVRYVKK